MKKGKLLGLAGALLLISLIGLLRLQLDVQVLNLLPPDLPTVRGLKLYEAHFANANELVLTLRGDDPALVENAARELGQVLRSETNLVAETLWAPPWQENPGGMAELVGYMWLNAPPPIISNLLVRLNPAQLDHLLEESKNRLANSLSPEEIARIGYDPFGLLDLPGAAGSFGEDDELFASGDGKFRLLFVQARGSTASYQESQRWLQEIKDVVSQWQERSPLGGKVVLRYTGRPAFVSEISGHMERDITRSVGGTLVVIGVLFWIAHRQLKPLLWLIFLVLVVLCLTLAAGGIILGTLNIISIGFAAILLGLAVDYGLVLYQEFLAHPQLSASEVKRLMRPGILWAAATTAVAFLTLNFGGLPGLAQLGTLVGCGILIGGGVMLGFFLKPFSHMPRVGAPVSQDLLGVAPKQSRLIWMTTALVGGSGIFLLWFAPPRVDVSSSALRPANSHAFQAVEEIKKELNRPEEPLWLIGHGKSFDAIATQLETLKPVLEQALSSGLLERVDLPGLLLPRPQAQQENASRLRALTRERDVMQEAALAHGFKPEAFELTDVILSTWQEAATQLGGSEKSEVYLPRAPAARWILDRFLSQTKENPYVLGMLHPNPEATEGVRALMQQIQQTGFIAAGWEFLGHEVYRVVKRRGLLLAGTIGCFTLVFLWLAFRNTGMVMLSLLTLLYSGLALNLLMFALDWSWNLMNLMAVPLLAGAGLDYSIHVQLGLRRHCGNIKKLQATVGRALFLCAGTTAVGFGSLAWAGNAGLATLGKICAAGILCCCAVSVGLLPIWSRSLYRTTPPDPQNA